jgi:hypothetical protein
VLEARRRCRAKVELITARGTVKKISITLGGDSVVAVDLRATGALTLLTFRELRLLF